MSKILFSVIICNYNYGAYLENAILSCLKQDLDKELYEIIVVDDGSTDTSRDILSKYKDVPQLKCILQENQGQAASFAQGFQNASGRYICFLDSDDYYLPNKLLRCAQHLDKVADTEILLCHDSKLYNQLTHGFHEQTWFEAIKLHSHFESTHLNQVLHPYPFANPCGQVYSRGILEKIFEVLPFSDWKQGADNPIAQSAFMLTERIHYLSEPLSVYRIHGSNHFWSLTEDGKLQAKLDWRTMRWPKLMSFLERFLDYQNLDEQKRSQYLSYLKQKERTLRVSSGSANLKIPKVSFIVTNYNYAAYLPACLDSILAQTHNNFEIVIVDDASTDSSREIIANYAQKFHEIKYKLLQDNIGQLGAIAEGYKLIEGDYFVLVDSDDELDRVFAEQHLHVHRYASLCMVTSSDIRFIDQNNKLLHNNCYASAKEWKLPLEYNPPFSVPFEKWIFAPCSANMFRKTAFVDLMFSELQQDTIESLRTCADWLILYYAFILGGSTRFSECLTSFRIHPNNKSTQLHFPTSHVKALKGNHPDYVAAKIFLFRLLRSQYETFKKHYTKRGLYSFCKWLLGKDRQLLPIFKQLSIAKHENPELMQILQTLSSDKQRSEV